MKNLFDRYSRRARLYPTLILLVPVWFFLYGYWGVELSDWEKLIFQSSLGLAFVFLVSELVVRNLGKFFETQLFNKGLGFPTTRWLMKSDKTLGQQRKTALYKKIKKDFNYDLDKASKKEIADAVSQIRLKVANGKLVLQYLERYGAWRNLSSSSLFSALMAAGFTLFLWLNQNEFWIAEFTLALAFLVVFLLRKKIMLHFADEYAEQIFNEYLSLK